MKPTTSIEKTQGPSPSVAEIRKHARANVEDGAITEGYRADREVVLKRLNESLATEIVCVLRYKRHYYMASGIHAQRPQQSFSNMRQRNRFMQTGSPNALCSSVVSQI